MVQQKTLLKQGQYYHIYNRGINSCAIFREPTNYEHFLRLYDNHISPIANTLAWVLMKNHFHLLVEILPVECWTFPSHPDPDPEGFQNLRGLKGPEDGMEPEKRLYQQFSNLFNAYTKAYNKRYHRTGSLFEHPFRRKQIDSIDYLKNLIVYIHQNPVKHRFCESPSDYPWSSYLSCVTLKPTKLKREKVIAIFGTSDTFKTYHRGNYTEIKLDDWFEL